MCVSVVGETRGSGEGMQVGELIQRETKKTTIEEGASEENGKSCLYIIKLGGYTEP